MIHVMCGIMGSGKSTLSKKLALEYDAVLYCYDAFPNAHKRVGAHRAMWSRIARDLKNNKTVVCDDLHITQENRADMLRAISKIDCKKVLHVMHVPPEICLERVRNREKWNVPDYVVMNCHKHYEEPTLDEGWDEIIYHEYVKE